MREVSIWTQAPARTRRKVVQFLSVAGGIEFDYGVVSNEQDHRCRSAGAELVFIRWPQQFYPLGERGTGWRV